MLQNSRSGLIGSRLVETDVDAAATVNKYDAKKNFKLYRTGKIHLCTEHLKHKEVSDCASNVDPSTGGHQRSRYFHCPCECIDVQTGTPNSRRDEHTLPPLI